MFVGVVIATTASFCFTFNVLSITSSHCCFGGFHGIIGSKNVSGKMILKSAI